MAIDRAIYTAHARATGGRAGAAKSDDGQIDLKLNRPIEMGGKGNGTDPEQLAAAGYAACFIGALKIVAGDSEVSFGPLAGGVEGYGILPVRFPPSGVKSLPSSAQISYFATGRSS